MCSIMLQLLRESTTESTIPRPRVSTSRAHFTMRAEKLARARLASIDLGSSSAHRRLGEQMRLVNYYFDRQCMAVLTSQSSFYSLWPASSLVTLARWY